MFGFGGILSKVLGGALVVVVLISGLYFWYSQSKIGALTQSVGTLQADKARLEGAIQVQNDSIKKLEETRAKDQERILELAKKNYEYTKEVEDLKKKFQRHDLDNLSLKKPGLIENIINKGTDKVLRDLERLSNPEQPAPKKPGDNK